VSCPPCFTARAMSGTPCEEFPRRLCDCCFILPLVGLHDKIISQGVGGDRVYVGIRHPGNELNLLMSMSVVKAFALLAKLFFCHLTGSFSLKYLKSLMQIHSV